MTSVYQQPPERARVTITIPFGEWVENTGIERPGDHLHYDGRFVINNVDMHLEAIRVNKRPEEGPYAQDAEAPELRDGFNALWAINNADGPLMTWTAPNGEEYVFVLTPHTD